MGSLFKLRDFWDAALHEECSHDGAMVLSNIDNAADGKLKIVLGTFQGILRVIQPLRKGSLKPEEVLLEKQFGEPILQVASGSFVPGVENSLAILLPKSLVVATVARGDTAAEEVAAGERGDAEGQPAKDTGGAARQHPTVFLLVRVVQKFDFQHASYNFTHGCFGKAPRDMICVQSLDGQLSIMEYNKMVCQRFLPEEQFLVPGYLRYCEHSDAFVTNNSAMELLCYNYLTVAHSFGSERRDSGPGEGSKILPAWSFNLGEDVTGISLCSVVSRGTEAARDLVVLCSHTLYILTQTGTLVFNKRLDVGTTCLAAYAVADPDGVKRSSHLLIGNSTGSVNVYNDIQLLWSAYRPTGAAMSLAVGRFCDTEGLIACLGYDGSLSLNYLGTDPASEPAQPLNSAEVDYDQLNKEYRSLQKTIKRALGTSSDGKHDDAENGGEKKKRAGAKKPTGSGPVEIACGELSRAPGDPSNPRVACMNLRMTNCSSEEEVGGITVIVQVCAPIVAEPSSVTLEQRLLPLQSDTLASLSNAVLPVKFTVAASNDYAMPTSLQARIAVMYTTTSTNAFHVAQTSVILPLTLLASTVPMLRNPSFSVQVNTDKDTPLSLAGCLFQDCAELGEVTANTMSVLYPNGADATLIVSKNACRFRLQSSTMEGLWLLTSEMVRRLRLHFGDAVVLSIPDEVPLEAFFSVVDTHVLIREEVISAQRSLADASSTFRVVQKKLLSRFREANPSSLGNLEVVFVDAYRGLQEKTLAVENSEVRLRQASAMLSCCASLLVLIIEIKCQQTLRSSEDLALLKAVLATEVPSTVTAGWEETVEEALSHVQHAKVGRQAAGQDTTAALTPLALKKDVSNLKKLLRAFVARLLNGEAISAAGG